MSVTTARGSFMRARLTDVLNSDALRTTIFTAGFFCLNAIAFGALFPSTVLPLIGVAV